jgi:hypothetical protein
MKRMMEVVKFDEAHGKTAGMETTRIGFVSTEI